MWFYSWILSTPASEIPQGRAAHLNRRKRSNKKPKVKKCERGPSSQNHSPPGARGVPSRRGPVLRLRIKTTTKSRGGGEGPPRRCPRPGQSQDRRARPGPSAPSAARPRPPRPPRTLRRPGPQRRSAAPPPGPDPLAL